MGVFILLVVLDLINLYEFAYKTYQTFK